MNRLNLLVIGFYFATALCSSCNKPDDDDKKRDVYVAGWESNTQGVYVAVLWKNGIPQYLTDGTENASAMSVFVSGDDVYVVGENPSNTVVLWKNGELQYLTDGEKSFSGCGSVFVSGNDVYVAGYDGQRAVLWKNGVAQELTEGLFDSCAISVFVSDNDVYVAGFDENFERGRDATIWKNGVAQKLNDCPSPISLAYCVYVMGNDVYVTGYAYNGTDEYGNNMSVAKLWKNGMEQTLSKDYAEARSIYISENDVYVALTTGPSTTKRAALWKNGTVQNLTNEYSKIEGSNSVYVSREDVYVVGDELKPHSNWVAKLWKNGVAQDLTSGKTNAGANSVFVK